ncbi:hypothetical protein F5879DRAFT_990143 [Lentinula edodes]|uniref:uncharacterized protein n=1 Tax=Lentinula edodes TaxID=5353 RepID=UPI001E8DC00F|nr:uncharacterized protein C8R40DRAFT_1173398 [Lentinula edodes]KAH7872647.1 hypothetical protein C8R40DRAFT_1173398 [Lentinula edodes]KAJ3903411.1 hypothetical protein F5879DRAFT_990143 [Lentinula edodes]
MFSRLAVRRVPRVATVSVRYSSSAKEGSVAQSRGFKERESAVEMLPNLLDEYAHKQEHAKLMKLKAEIELKKIELEKLEKEHAEAEKK